MMHDAYRIPVAGLTFMHEALAHALLNKSYISVDHTVISPVRCGKVHQPRITRKYRNFSRTWFGIGLRLTALLPAGSGVYRVGVAPKWSAWGLKHCLH